MELVISVFTFQNEGLRQKGKISEKYLSYSRALLLFECYELLHSASMKCYNLLSGTKLIKEFLNKEISLSQDEYSKNEAMSDCIKKFFPLEVVPFPAVSILSQFTEAGSKPQNIRVI
jgi:hypothetical protein